MVSHHYQVEPHQDRPLSSISGGRVLDQPPINTGFSRPFSDPPSQYRMSRGAEVHTYEDNGIFQSQSNAIRQDGKRVARHEQSKPVMVRAEGSSNDPKTRTDATAEMSRPTHRKEERRSVTVNAADIVTMAAEGATHPEECHTTVDEKGRRGSRSRSSSSSSHSSCSTSVSSDCQHTPEKQNKTAKGSKHEDTDGYTALEGEDNIVTCKTLETARKPSRAPAVKEVAMAPLKPVRINPASSFKKATQAMVSSVRQGQGVVMEDDNIVVQQQLYSVVYKDTGKVFASIQTHVKSALEEMKKNIASICEKRLEAFTSKIDKLVASETTRLTSKSVVRTEDSHKYVLFTAKSPKVFHTVTAADRVEMERKCVRYCKNVKTLVLTFSDTERFGVRRMREIFKDRGMAMKTRNDFNFPVSDIEDLDTFLVRTFSDASVGDIDETAYRITVISDKRQKQNSTKKDAVVRSRREEETDALSEHEPPADERLRRDGVRYDGGGERSASEDYDSSSDGETSSRRRAENKRKRSKIGKTKYDYKGRDDEDEEERRTKRKRSHR